MTPGQLNPGTFIITKDGKRGYVVDSLQDDRYWIKIHDYVLVEGKDLQMDAYMHPIPAYGSRNSCLNLNT